MEKVFWIDPYQHTLKTKVIDINDNEILLEKTIAFSFSGGQESDRAYINNLEVTGSRIQDNLIFYQLSEDHNLLEQQDVVMTINWPRRYRLMRLHFAAELILEIVTQKYQLEKVGAHIAESKARIDFKSDQNIANYFEEILSDYNEIIQKDLPIETDFSDFENQRRFWKIQGFAEVPCGGTHVKSTAEVGLKGHTLENQLNE